MAGTESTRRPAGATRRAGYIVTAVCDAALLYLINVWPGWQAVSFLTQDTRQVLGLVNLSLAASLAANLVYMAQDAPMVKSLGELVTTGIGLVVLVRIWQVFPVDFTGWSVDWSWLVRLTLGVGIIGSLIGLAVQAASVLRQLASGGPHPTPSP